MQERADMYIEFFEQFLMLCMDKSGCSIGLHQKSQVIVPAGKAEAIAIAATDENQE